MVFWFEESNTLDPRINMFLKIIPGVVTEINRSSVFLSNPLFRLVFPLLPKELINSPVKASKQNKTDSATKKILPLSPSS